MRAEMLMYIVEERSFPSLFNDVHEPGNVNCSRLSAPLPLDESCLAETLIHLHHCQHSTAWTGSM